MTAAQEGGADISIVVKFFFFSGALSDSSPDWDYRDEDDESRARKRHIESQVEMLLQGQVMSALQQSMAQTVSIALHITSHVPTFFSALCRAPAPRLRRFHCRVYGRYLEMQALPEDLFRLVAPSLDAVDLAVHLALPSRSVPSFLCASRVRVAIPTSDFSKVVAQFPNVRHLECVVYRHGRNDDLSSLNSTQSRAAILVLGRQLHSLNLAVHGLFWKESCQVSPALDLLLDACSNIASVAVVVRESCSRYIPCIRPNLHSLSGPITLVLRDAPCPQPRAELYIDWFDASRYKRIGFSAASRTTGRTLTGHFEHLSPRWLLDEISVLHGAVNDLDVWYWCLRPRRSGLEILAGYPCIQRLRIDLTDGDGVLYDETDTEGENLRDLLDVNPRFGDSHGEGYGAAPAESDSDSLAVARVGDDALSNEPDHPAIPPPASPWPALQHLAVYASGEEVAVSVADLVTFTSRLLLAGPRPPSKRLTFHVLKSVVVEAMTSSRCTTCFRKLS